MKRKISFQAAAGGLLLAMMIISLATPQPADAIPAFARKYQMSCTTCHNPVPRLKDYGDEFAANGFALRDKDAPRYFVETGDSKLSLIRDFPIAVRMDGFIKYESATDRDVDLSAPYIVKLLSGGALTQDVAYYFYFYMSEHGEIVGIEDAYIMFNNLFGSELDFYLGQFQVCDPLFKRELRLTYEDYQIYKTKVGKSQISLSYDRGFMMTYGFPSGTDFVLEVVNGNGLAEADDFKVYDTDKYKSVAGRISQDVGDYLRIGGFGYWGKEGSHKQNEVWYLGPDLTLTDGKYLTLNAQYLERRDTDPLFVCACRGEIKTRGAMVELVLTPEGDRSGWYGVGLFNWVESDMERRYRSVSGHLGYLLRTNIRLVGELTYDIESTEKRLVVGFVSAY